MKTYSKFMAYLWLALFIMSTIMVTYKGFTEGWNKWYAYFIFPGICLIFYFIRRKGKKGTESPSE